MRNFNNGHNKALAGLVLAASLVLLALPASAGPVIAPGHKLYLIKTEHFDIIFPEASRPTALRLSAMAESVYDEVAGKLEAKLPDRVPVVITPDIGSFNGNTNPFPYMHIVLYDTSLDIGWTSFKDNFRNLFLHELTHAVSMQIRAPWASFLSGIFGSWLLPGLLNSPEFMVEGAAVSFESDDAAGGRANDPQVKERVRQDIIENRFKSPMEASGIYDEYPYGNVYYEYGGLFNAYIQKTYGMEKYAELWKSMGTLIFTLTLDPYEIGFYKAFHRTYGFPFLKAWADFRNSLELKDIVDPPEALGPKDLAWMSGGLAGNESSLYWVDARSKRAMRMDIATGKSRALFDADSASAISDASSGRILVSRAVTLSDGRDRRETLAYDLGAKRFVAGSSVPDMREARFFRDGFVGIVSRLHDTDLVFASKAGTRVLLPGSEEIMYSQPAVLDERRIALIVAIGGKRSIGILDADTLELSLVRPAGDDAELLTYVRQISASADRGRLYFNYDSDDRLYKLGALDLDSGTIGIATADYSGGVFSPRAAGGRVYYLGRFSEGDKICRYPGDLSSLGPGQPGWRSLGYSLESFDPKSGLAEGGAVAATAVAAAAVAIEPYRPLAYANPFNMWFLYPDLANIQRSFRLFGTFYLQDPTADNTLLLSAGYDYGYRFADTSLSWTNQALPVAIGASLGDTLVYGTTGAPERQSTASLAATWSLPVFPSPRYAEIGLGGLVFDRSDGEGGSAYGWAYSGWNATASALLGWFGRIPGVEASTARGIDLVSYHDFDVASRTYKTEEHLVASLDRAPLRLDLWGAWASSPILRLDSASPVFSADRRPGYVEFASLRPSSSNLLVEGTVAYRLADASIHSNLLELYFNRLLVDLGFRGAWVQGETLCSTFARLSLDIAAAEGMAFAGARVFGEAFARLDGSSLAQAYGLRIGLQLSGDAGTPMKGGTFDERRDFD